MRICLLTTGQPSINPRLVKEADALTEAGHEVDVLCAHWIHWADSMDKVLSASRPWKCQYVGGHPNFKRTRYYWTRLRHGLTRRSLALLHRSDTLSKWALCRVLPELESAAKKIPADLYISHYPGSLPAAVKASQMHNTKVGFDIEDFHTESLEINETKSVQDWLVEHYESIFLPKCDYVTSGSPQIADTYMSKYNIPRPIPILNVFPLNNRPKKIRYSNRRSPLTLYWFSQTIGENRGLEDVIQAMGGVRKYNIELHLLGTWQKGYKEKLYKLASLNSLKQEQIISHPPSSPDRMIQISSQYDIGLALEQNTSEMRDLCLTNKIFTYLLAGNAVIATNTKAQSAIMEKIGNAGFCYKHGDIESLSCQLKFWYEDRDALQMVRQVAWDWGERRYNWGVEKKRFLKVISSLF